MSKPLSRPLIVAAIPPNGERIEVVADAAERAELAAMNEVESIEALKAVFEVRRAGRDGLEVRGVVEAETTRICVVTLEPFVETVSEAVDVRFAPEDEASSDGEGDDPPDAIVGGVVDLGAVAAEFFTLGLDMYPRKPGVSFDEASGDGVRSSPFAALGKLKPHNGGGA